MATTINYATSPEVLKMQVANKNKEQSGEKQSDQMLTTERNKQIYDEQMNSKRGKKIEQAVSIPGSAVSMLGRSQTLNKSIEKVGNRFGSDGLGEKVITGMTQAGGAAYGITKGAGNVRRQKRLAFEKSYSKELGTVGRVSRATDSLNMASKMAYSLPMTAALMTGHTSLPGNMKSLQSSMGLYNAMGYGAKEVTKNAATGAVTEGIKGGALGAVGGMAPFLAAQIGMSMWKSHKISKIRAQKKSGFNEADKIGNPVFNTLDQQLNRMQSDQQMSPGDALLYQAMRIVGVNSMVLPLIYERMDLNEQRKEKGNIKGYEKQTQSPEQQNQNIIDKSLDHIEGFLSPTLAKFDVFGQLFNFVTTGQTPKQFIDQLKSTYKSPSETKEIKKQANFRGISYNDNRLLGTNSSQLLATADTFESKQLSILSALFDINRVSATELLTIRKDGFGVYNTEGFSNEYSGSSIGKVFKSIVSIPEAIPGLNAIANIAKLPFTIGNKAKELANKAWKGIKTGVLGEETELLLSNEEELRKKAGVYKSEGDKATDFIGRGLPDSVESIRAGIYKQVEYLHNIYSVMSDQYKYFSGLEHEKDENTFSKLTERGVWSETAGKYLNKKGLKAEQDRVRDKMVNAIEDASKGSAADIFYWLKDQAKANVNSVKVKSLDWKSQLTNVDPDEQLKINHRMQQLTDEKDDLKNRNIYDRISSAANVVGKADQFVNNWTTDQINTNPENQVFNPEDVIRASEYRMRSIRGRNRGKQDFFNLDVERESRKQKSIGAKFSRGISHVKGGLASATLGSTLGYAGMLTANPLLMAAGFGAGSIMGGGEIQKKRTEQISKVIDKNSDAFTTDSVLNIGSMPEYSDDQKQKVNNLLGNNIDFKDINNFEAVTMALQDVSKTPTTVSDFNNRFNNDIFGIESITEKAPLPVQIVSVASDVSYMKTAANDDYGINNYLENITQELISTRNETKNYDQTNSNIVPFPTMIPTVNNIVDNTHETKDLSESNTVSAVAQTHSRNVKQELAEVEEKEKEENSVGRENTMIEVLTDIRDNTEESGKAGKGQGDQKGKKSGSFLDMFGGLNMALISAILPILTMIGTDGEVGKKAMVGVLDKVVRHTGSKVKHGVQATKKVATKTAESKAGQLAGKAGKHVLTKVAQTGTGQTIVKNIDKTKNIVGKTGKTVLSKVAETGVGKTATTVGKTVASKAGAIAGKDIMKKASAKMVGKKIPGLSVLMGLGFGAKRLLEGDLLGAGLEVASGVSGSFLGLGTVGSVALDGILLKRDLDRAKEKENPNYKELQKLKPVMTSKAFNALKGDPHNFEALKDAGYLKYSPWTTKYSLSYEYHNDLKNNKLKTIKTPVINNHMAEVKDQIKGIDSKVKQNLNDVKDAKGNNVIRIAYGDGTLGIDLNEANTITKGSENSSGVMLAAAHGGISNQPFIAGEDGPEVAVPLTPDRFVKFMRRIDPAATKLDLQKQIDSIAEKQETQKIEPQNVVRQIEKQPIIVPTNTNNSAEPDDIIKDKLYTDIDRNLTSFIDSLFDKTINQFGQIYTNYVYDGDLRNAI